MRNYFIILFLFVTYAAFSQSNDEEQVKRQNVIGINFNTNAGIIGGFNYRYTKYIKGEKFFRTVGLEIVEVKHDKEVKQNTSGGSSFVYGKVNDFYVIRPNIGFEYELMRKGEDDGIRLNFLFMGGPSIGVMKPYYVEYYDGTDINYVAFNPKIHDPNNVLGAGGFLYGWDGLRFAIGLHAKAGMLFEFSPVNSDAVSGVEVGVMGEVFNEKIRILDLFAGSETFNRQAFLSAYITIFFGWQK